MRQASAIHNSLAITFRVARFTLWFAKTGNDQHVAELIGWVRVNPSMSNAIKRETIEIAFAVVREHLSAVELDAAMERGKAMRIDTIVAEILEQGAERERKTGQSNALFGQPI